MGWFDNDPKDKPPAGAPRPATSPPPAPPTRPAGSTIGKGVHISGTVVANEELTIHGKVDGDIHARQPLRIAKGAAVKALVEGTRVLLEGSMEGNLVATEVAVLGPTARLAGDIKAPSLEVQDGALLKGSVEMPRPQAPKARATTDATAAKPLSPTSASVDNSPEPSKPTTGKTSTAKPRRAAGSTSPASAEPPGSKAKEVVPSGGEAKSSVAGGSAKTARS